MLARRLVALAIFSHGRLKPQTKTRRFPTVIYNGRARYQLPPRHNSRAYVKQPRLHVFGRLYFIYKHDLNIVILKDSLHLIMSQIFPEPSPPAILPPHLSAHHANLQPYSLHHNPPCLSASPPSSNLEHSQSPPHELSTLAPYSQWPTVRAPPRAHNPPPRARKANLAPASSNTVPSDRRPIVMSGPSGVGKGTLYKLLFERHPETFVLSVSHTTRAPRPGEGDAVDYHFVTMDSFESLIAQDGFVEHAKFGGNRYGTSKMTIEEQSKKGKVVLLDIEMEVWRLALHHETPV